MKQLKLIATLSFLIITNLFGMEPNTNQDSNLKQKNQSFLISQSRELRDKMIKQSREDFSDSEDKKKNIIIGCVNQALNLDCWCGLQEDGSMKMLKVGEIIKLSNYGENKEGYGNVLFYNEFDYTNNAQNLYIKIQQTGEATHVNKNILTVVWTDLFEGEPTQENFKEKTSQKTGLFFDNIGETTKRKVFAKKYNDFGIEYGVSYVIAHELIHFMQNKKGDFELLKQFSTTPNEQTIISNVELLKKYQNSLLRHIDDPALFFELIHLKTLIDQNKSCQSIIQECSQKLINKIELNFECKTNEDKIYKIKLLYNADINKIQYMEKLIEESALIGVQWDEDSINEWWILYANKMPVRYPYSQQQSSVFMLDHDTAKRIFDSVFEKLSIDSNYNYVSSMSDEIEKLQKKKTEPLSTDYQPKKQIPQKIQANMFKKMIDKQRKTNDNLKDEDLALQILARENDNQEILNWYNAWNDLNKK